MAALPNRGQSIGGSFNTVLSSVPGGSQVSRKVRSQSGTTGSVSSFTNLSTVEDYDSFRVRRRSYPQAKGSPVNVRSDGPV